jgi:hypothetical protein
MLMHYFEVFEFKFMFEFFWLVAFQNRKPLSFILFPSPPLWPVLVLSPAAKVCSPSYFSPTAMCRPQQPSPASPSLARLL